MYKTISKIVMSGCLVLSSMLLMMGNTFAIISWRVMVEPTSGKTVVIIGDLHKETKVFEVHAQELITWLEGMKGGMQCLVELPEGAKVFNYEEENFRGSTWKVIASYMKDKARKGISTIFKPCCPTSRAMVNLISISDLIEKFKKHSQEMTKGALELYLNQHLPPASKSYISDKPYTLVIEELTDALRKLETWQKELSEISKTAVTVVELHKKMVHEVGLKIWQRMVKIYRADLTILSFLTSCIPISSTMETINHMLQGMIVMPIYRYVEAAFFYSILKAQYSYGAQATVVITGETHAQNILTMLSQVGYVLDKSKSWYLDAACYDALSKDELSPEEMAKLVKDSIPTSLAQLIKGVNCKNKKEHKENKGEKEALHSVSSTQCDNELCTTAQRALKCCGGCKKVSYCSRECQKAHWKFHKQVCK